MPPGLEVPGGIPRGSAHRRRQHKGDRIGKDLHTGQGQQQRYERSRVGTNGRQSGGTTGGTDIIARILDLKLGIPVGKSLLALDAFVLTISLSYLDIKHMIYTLLASFVLARITDSIQAGSYAARGLFIISDKYEQIAKMIDVQLDRGYTFINAEGGFDRSAKKIIYCVISPREISQVKELILREDPNAFVSVIDVHEALGQGFTYERKKRHIFFRR